MINIGIKDEEEFCYGDRSYKVIKVDVNFNKPFSSIYSIDGNEYIFINSDATEEENREVIGKLLNSINPFKGIFKDLSESDISVVNNISTLREFEDTGKLSEYIDKIDESAKDAYLTDTWKMLMFYKLGVMKGKREERKSRRRKLNV